jgi:RimJ/RimL family protein N-acetyltransferase
MDARSNEVCDLVLSLDEEPPFEGTKRALLVVGGSIAAALVASLGFGVDLWSDLKFLLILPLGALAESVGQRRGLVLRNHDFYLTGGSGGLPISWDSLESIEPVGTGVLLTTGTGQKIPLHLEFLELNVRNQAIARMQRAFAIHRIQGPLNLPDPAFLASEEGGLRLVRWGLEHRALSRALMCSPENTQFQLGEPPTAEMASALIAAQEASPALAGFRRFVIESEASPVGCITILVTDPILRHAEMGVDLLPEHCNRGLGTAAIQLVLTFLQKQTNLSKATAGAFSDNLRCRRALEKAGMRHVGQLAKFWFKAGSWKSGDLFELDLEAARQESAPIAG